MVIFAYLLYIFIEYPLINLLGVIKNVIELHPVHLDISCDYNYVYKIRDKPNEIEFNDLEKESPIN